LCKIWSRFILKFSGFYLEVEFEEQLDASKAYIICPNHVSYLDIPVTFAIMPGVFVFVGKKSLSKIPIFGWVYKKTMILVDRSNNRSSYNAFKHASERISNGVGIAIYPEGGIPVHETKLNRFKSGAFRMAIEQGADLIPVTFADNKKKFPTGRLGGSPGKLRVYVHKPITAGTYKSESMQKFKSDVYAIIDEKLTEYES
jgi:1-acyl-sn-glycerol-3-phosphate acyltransferase